VIVRSWLVVRADGSLRINSKNPTSRLALDEIAVPIEVRIPAGWGKAQATGITVQMPEPPEVVEQVRP
jgi:hypothetical protein